MPRSNPAGATTEAGASKALQREQPPQWEARTPQLESSPRLPPLEKASAQQQKTQGSQKKKKKSIKSLKK